MTAQILQLNVRRKRKNLKSSRILINKSFKCMFWLKRRSNISFILLEEYNSSINIKNLIDLNIEYPL